MMAMVLAEIQIPLQVMILPSEVTDFYIWQQKWSVTTVKKNSVTSSCL